MSLASLPRVAVLLLVAVAAGAASPSAGAAGLGLGRCGDSGLRKTGFRCAKVTVPKDYADPAAGTLRLAVTVKRATGRSRGPLFVNFGGPGGNTVAGLQGFLPVLPRSLRRHFDLVGMDPRGVGRSRPAIDCKVDQRTRGIYGVPFQRPGEDPAAAAARVQAYVDRCSQRNASVAPYVGTANVARDMDHVRDLLGAPKLTYLGFSYGTVLGATYLKLFPDHYRAAVLDGVVDVDQWYNRPHDGLVTQTGGLEDALNRFLGASGKGRGYAPWASGKDPREAFDALVAKASAKPLPSHTKGDRAPVTGDEVLNATAQLLYAKQLWPQLRAVLNGVRAGNGRQARAWANEALGGRRKNGDWGPGLDRYFVITAADQPYADDPAAYQAWGDLAAPLFPHFFFNVGYAEANYGRWPFEGVGVDRGPFTLPATAPQALVIGTTHDPATPYVGAQSTAAQLGRARLLTMQGDGHTAFRNGSGCIDRAIEAYLLAVRLPAQNTRCRQRIPFPPASKRAARASAAAAAHALRFGQPTPIRSTTKTSVSSGPITPPAPRLP